MSYYKHIFLFSFLFLQLKLLSFPNLDDKAQDFIIEKRQIAVPGYPFAYNPSIVRWNNQFLMSFRIRGSSRPNNNRIGLIRLDSDFNPLGEPKILNIHAPQAGEEDLRLIMISNHLYIAYNNWKIRRMFIGELIVQDNNFTVVDKVGIFELIGQSLQITKEKNWVPFDYNDTLLFAYSLSPHKILRLIPGTNDCEIVALTHTSCRWDWGELRGGTPALLVDGKYIAFFHSSQKMATEQSEGKEKLYYFMGAYIFSTSFPFAITHMSPEPIIAKGFYEKHDYRPYKKLSVIFPTGFVYDEQYIWVFYGRHDSETWFVKLDKKKLFESLVPVNLKT